MTADVNYADKVQAPTHSPVFSKAYTRYALWLLVGVNICNYLDRQVVMILAEPIKRDLGMTDTQLGLTAGLAFSLFYTALGLPIARLADRKDRTVIIGCAAAAWSLFTVLCSQARNVTQLILYRVGVGIGEAGCIAPAQSLIVDVTPKEKRATALSLFSAGANMGILLGMVSGGLIADAAGWRMAFLVAGGPGLILAVLVLTTLKEPRRRLQANALQAQQQKPMAFRATLALLAAKRTYWLVAGSLAIKTMLGYGFGAFVSAFYLRNHATELAQLSEAFGMKPVGFLGTTIGLSAGITGVLGAYLGGWIADKLAAKSVANYLTVAALGTVLGIPFLCTAFLLHSVLWALAFMSLAALLTPMSTGPTWATIHSIIPSEMRAEATAVTLLITNFMGLGLGPLALGALSDALNIGLDVGPAEGVRWALILSTVLGVIPFAGFWLARRSIDRDVVG